MRLYSDSLVPTYESRHIGLMDFLRFSENSTVLVLCTTQHYVWAEES